MPLESLIRLIGFFTIFALIAIWEFAAPLRPLRVENEGQFLTLHLGRN